MYSRAWLGYVNEVRRMIEQHYKDEYQQMMREREELMSPCPNRRYPST